MSETREDDVQTSRDMDRYDEYSERVTRSRSRSRSPDGYSDNRRRSLSPRGEGNDSYRRRNERSAADQEEEKEARNEGTNLFVTGLSRSVTDHELEDLFNQYAPVDKCQIMLDPHTRESRGFGFVNMQDVDGADRIMSELNGYELAGKTLSIEKAKRKRPRTPTPGKYFGPPKPRRRGGGRSRYYDDHSYSRGDHYSRKYDDQYDDYYRRGSSRYDDRDRYYRDRGYSRYDDRDRYAPAPSRDYRDYRDRDSGYRSPPPREDYGPSRDYRDDRTSYREDRAYRDSYDRDSRDDYR